MLLNLIKLIEFIISLPWDQRTPFGYFTENIISSLSGFTYITINGAFLALFTATCDFHRAFYEMFRNKIEECEEISYEKHEVLRIRFKESVQFHIRTKE